jgi:hypothetical protein
MTDEAGLFQVYSRAAITSVVLALLGLSGYLIAAMLVTPLLGLIFGWIGLRTITKYPDELLGRPIAIAGICLSGLIFVSGVAYHIYDYATEVPEGYQRVSFYSFMAGKGQPDTPTADAIKCNGMDVFIKGYVHPSSISSGQAKKFVIVPDLGTCCFGGQPPLTHMIEVSLAGDQYAHKDWRKKKLAGKFSVNPSPKPIEELQGVYYQLRADYLK